VPQSTPPGVGRSESAERVLLTGVAGAPLAACGAKAAGAITCTTQWSCTNSTTHSSDIAHVLRVVVVVDDDVIVVVGEGLGGWGGGACCVLSAHWAHIHSTTARSDAFRLVYTSPPRVAASTPSVTVHTVLRSCIGRSTRPAHTSSPGTMAAAYSNSNSARAALPAAVAKRRGHEVRGRERWR
jgi:hypothetical protein